LTPDASLDLGTCPHGYGFGGTGKKSNNKQFDNYGEAFGKGDVIGCYLDLDNKEISFTKNGINLGVAFPIPRSQEHQPFFPALVLKNAEMVLNFGDQPWKFPPRDGFTSFTSAPEKQGQMLINLLWPCDMNVPNTLRRLFLVSLSSPV
jgi:ATP-dependent RNA helicase DDX1